MRFFFGGPFLSKKVDPGSRVCHAGNPTAELSRSTGWDPQEKVEDDKSVSENSGTPKSSI